MSKAAPFPSISCKVVFGILFPNKRRLEMLVLVYRVLEYWWACFCFLDCYASSNYTVWEICSSY